MKLEDYIKNCMKNPEFKKYWNEEDVINETYKSSKKELSETMTLSELFKYLNEDEQNDELNNLIKNKGVKATIVIPNTIEFYENGNHCPVEEFLNSIKNQQLKIKTLKNILRLAEIGNKARYPLTDYVDNGIFELRTQESGNLTRIFYFFVFGSKIILTNGYIKKSQKLDKLEFNKALNYMKDYYKNN